MGFTTLGLSDPVMQGVLAAGYTAPTPIQSLAIRPALEGRDIIGLAQTGTGKTAAFVLPVLDRLWAEKGDRARHAPPRALILTPTRELAQQIHKAVDTYGRFLAIRSVAIYGGVDMDKQLKIIHRGVDIVIATPGRLLDHMQRRSISLAEVRILVLDEADRMLDMGFIRDVRTIIAQVPASRQTMLFSATMPEEIASLADEVLRDPETVEAGERRNPVETIEQHFYMVSQEVKTALLLHALEQESMESVLVFTRTKHGADKIARRLDRAGIATAAIHSNRSQGQRDRALEAFKKGSVRVLVATDIAARGIDVSGISHVVNFDIPQQPEDYIHRIGRTGRAGAEGDAITFVTKEDTQYVRRIEKYTGKHLTMRSYPGFTPPEGQPAAVKTSRPAARPHARSQAHPQAPHQTARKASAPADGSSRHATRVSGISAYGNGPASSHPTGRPGTSGKKPGASGKPWDKMHAKKKRRTPVLAVRKKSPPKKLDSFSSHTGGPGWSNY